MRGKIAVESALMWLKYGKFIPASTHTVCQYAGWQSSLSSLSWLDFPPHCTLIVWWQRQLFEVITLILQTHFLVMNHTIIKHCFVYDHREKDNSLCPSSTNPLSTMSWQKCVYPPPTHSCPDFQTTHILVKSTMTTSWWQLCLSLFFSGPLPCLQF